MYRLAHWYMRLRGWRFEGATPTEPKFVILGVPHTSNWDFVVFLGTMYHHGLTARFLGKDAMFRWPFGKLMRRLGGIAVSRDAPGTIAADVAREFDETTAMTLVVAPEGTRGATSTWKSGFYRIALAARVPVVPAAVDLAHRRIELGPPIHLTGEAHRDMDAIRAFYDRALQPRPEGMGPIQIADEFDERGDA